jgi:hypothetical protein
MSTNEISRIASEWLDANKSRSYPFDESCGGAPGRIPTNVFTDAFFRCSGITGELYINRVVLGQTSFQIYAAAGSKDIGLLADIPYDTPERTKVPISILLDLDGSLDGFITVGEASAIKEMLADNVLTTANGKFFYGCVRDFSSSGLLGIRVGETVYSGVINLEAGEGVDIDVEEVAGETNIRISAKDREVPPENMLIVDDKTLAQEISALYGSPVFTINGVIPDESGNIILATPDASREGASGYAPFPAGVGTITLMDNSSNDISCENTVLDTLMHNIAELNARGAQLKESVDGLDEANSVMSLSLSRLS